MIKEYRLNYLNWQEVKKIVPDKINSIILPVGTIEAHGATGLGTDALIPEKMAELIAPRINCLIAPTIYYGITNTMLPYSGSISLTKDTFQSMIREVINGLNNIGFERIVILNGHGGQIDELKDLMTDIGKKKPLKMMLIQWWFFGIDAIKDVYGVEIEGGHAALEETAMILALAPDAVKQELYNEKIAYTVYPGLKAIPAPGTILNPEGAPPPDFNPTKAKRYADIVIDDIVRNIKIVFEQWDKLFC